jgi:hypothetical protein
VGAQRSGEHMIPCKIIKIKRYDKISRNELFLIKGDENEKENRK